MLCNLFEKGNVFRRPILKCLSFINPPHHLSPSFHDIEIITDRFPDVISAQQMDPPLSEIRDYQIFLNRTRQ